MVLGTLELELRLDGCFNLKDKRRILRSLLDHLHRDFHVAAAEVGDQELWNSAEIGVAAVSNDTGHVESVLQHIVDVVDAMPEVALVSASKDLERR